MLGLKAVEIAQKEVGKCEIPKGSNWGQDVSKYLNSVGLYKPAPWCMSFVYWSFDQAAKAMGVANPMLKTASVMMQWNIRKAYNAVTTPMPGDVFIMQDKANPVFGHTGIITSVAADGTLTTIEGNTNLTGEREGWQVQIKHRNPLSMKGFLRF